MHLKATIQAVYKMRKSGISVVSNAEEIPEQMLRYANEAWFKVSYLLLSLPAARVFQVAFSGLFFGLYGMNEKRSSESVIFVFRRLKARWF